MNIIYDTVPSTILANIFRVSHIFPTCKKMSNEENIGHIVRGKRAINQKCI